VANARSKLLLRYCGVLIALTIAATLVGTHAFRRASRDRLRIIVQQQCLPDWLENHNPAPCRSIKVMDAGPGAPGFAVLPDRKGGAHFLLIPITAISGIESPEVRAPGSLNYFGAAWGARDALAGVLGRPIPPDVVGMAVNQRRARSQDQLHIHISCLRRSVYDALQAAASQIGPDWSGIRIDGRPYQAMRVMGTELAANPFALVAERLHGATDALDQFTLLVAGMRFREGPGFALVAGRSVPGGELLLDPTCSMAR
jgi:CDP-diacylglycerol pyrophosphatase